MAKTNLTLKIDKGLLRKIKVLAAQRETSISGLTVSLYEQTLARDAGYEESKQKALARLAQGYHLGFKPPRSRDELHER